MNIDRMRNVIEAVIFASERPVTLEMLAQVLDDIDRKELKLLVDGLVTEWRSLNRGFNLVEVAGGWQFRTKSELAPWLQRTRQERPTKLSRASLETLSIIAYKQPITRPEIEDLRGVDSGAVVRNLLERNLVKIIGRKDAPGKPVVYATTERFLEVFSLRDLGSLPSLRDLKELEEGGGEQLTLPTPGTAAGGEGETEPEVIDDSERRRRIREQVRGMLGDMPIQHDEPLSAASGEGGGTDADFEAADDDALLELENALKRRKEVAERTEALLDDAERAYIEKVKGSNETDEVAAPDAPAGFHGEAPLESADDAAVSDGPIEADRLGEGLQPSQETIAPGRFEDAESMASSDEAEKDIVLSEPERGDETP